MSTQPQPQCFPRRSQRNLAKSVVEPTTQLYTPKSTTAKKRDRQGTESPASTEKPNTKVNAVFKTPPTEITVSQSQITERGRFVEITKTLSATKITSPDESFGSTDSKNFKSPLQVGSDGTVTLSQLPTTVFL